LGASKNDVELSIGLMDRAVDALRTCVVDDVHLGIRFANLLQTLTTRLRTRFMHAPSVPQPNNTGSARQTPPTRQDATQIGKVEASEPNPGWKMNTPGYQTPNVQSMCHVLIYSSSLLIQK
jgi:hypothetical protein